MPYEVCAGTGVAPCDLAALVPPTNLPPRVRLIAPADGSAFFGPTNIPVLEAWAPKPARDLPVYEAGSWGPEVGDALIARDGHAWRRP